MTVYEIPLIAQSQKFSITLAGINYNLRLVWNAYMQAWVLDINDTNNAPVIGGIPLVTGADLLEQYGYLVFGGQLIVQTDNNPDVLPTLDNLGSTSHLFFVVD